MYDIHYVFFLAYIYCIFTNNILQMSTQRISMNLIIDATHIFLLFRVIIKNILNYILIISNIL